MPFVCVLRYVRYLGPSEWSAGGERTLTNQGGYYCSVRARTAFENEDYVLDAPNFWSRYMDTKVGLWGPQRPPFSGFAFAQRWREREKQALLKANDPRSASKLTCKGS